MIADFSKTPETANDVELSVVIPVYMNSDSIVPLLESLEQVFSNFNFKCQIVFVVDASPDNSEEIINSKLPLRFTDIVVVSLSRNFGSISAVRTGLKFASGKYICVVAADLQEPTSLISDFHKALHENEGEIAIGKRVTRNDPIFTKYLASFYWKMYKKTINSDIPTGGVDVFACTKKVKDELILLTESGSSLVGLLYWVGFKRTYVEYSRLKRPFGKSAWTFKKKFRYLTDSIFAFSDAPIALLQFSGLLGMFTATLFGFFTLFGSLTKQIPVPGYTSIIVALTFSTSAILFGLGIVGEYAWRAYENTKGRPNSIVGSVRHVKSCE
jgi:glycosyltransferase involved in cell wall biosynthesis